MVAESVSKQVMLSAQFVDALVLRLRRRQIVGSRNVALATAALVQTVVRSVRYTTIEELLSIIRAIGKRLVEANPKELAAGNIVRRIIRLIREEYRAAAAAHLSQPPTAPGTPWIRGASTPGTMSGVSTPTGTGATGFASPTAAANYFSLAMGGRPAGSSGGNTAPPTPGMVRQASLSNFVAMRHSRVQSERAGGAPPLMTPGLGPGGLLELSVSTSNLFATPPRVVSNLQAAAAGHAQSPTSNMSMVDEADAAMLAKERDEFARQAGKLKPVLIQAIDEVVNELETTHEDVARGAREHIHSSEVILTLGHSRTVEAFLKAAFRDRKFTVIVLESAPSFLGRPMAAALAAAGIPTLLVPDSSLHAILPRVTKVILGAHSVSANGGMFALAGSLACALAARTHAKPVVVTTGQFKFAPAWNLYHQFDALDFQGPGPVIGYDHNGGGGGFEGVEVADPCYDYIRPELINLYATNVGDHPPSYIYRIIKEAYDDEDMEL